MRHTSPVRRAAGIVAVGLLLAVLIVGSAAGDPGSVFTIRAGGDLDWVPRGGGYGPSSSSNPTSASGTLSDQNGSADYSVAAGPGIVRGSIAGTFSTPGRFNPSVQADASSDLTLVGPTRYVAIPVSLNLHVDSTFKVEQCPDLCNISIGVQGYGGTTRFSIGAGFTENGLGLTADPVPGGFHLHGDVATPQFGLTPNLPAAVGISLQINVNNFNGGFAGSSVFTVGPSTVSFAPSGPVLNGVPAEYTVSGPGVDDNQWTDPFVPDIELRHRDGTPVGSGETLDLGTTPSGTTSAPGYFRIFNAGTANLHVSGVNPPSSFQVQGSGGEIAPGSDQEITVTCNATNSTANALTIEGDVVVQSDDPGESTVTLHVKCTVLPGQASTAPGIELRFADGTPMPATNPVVDLGDVPSGSVKPGTYRIANVGDATLEVSDIGHDTPAFGTAVAPTLSTSVSPGGSTAAQLGCGGGNPDTTPRDVEFAVTVHSNDPDEGAAQFTVRCRVLPAPVTPPPANPPDIELRFAEGTVMGNPPVLDLGNVESGERATREFLIANVGDGTLHVSRFTYVDGDCSSLACAVRTNNSIDAILPGSTGSALATCGNFFRNNTAAPVAVNEIVHIESDDPDENPLDLRIKCQVLSGLPPDPELRFADDTPMPDQTTFDLGDVASGSYVGAGYRVANVGGAYLYVMPGYAGFILDNGNYAVSSQSLSIAPGESKGGGGFSCGGINNYGTAREISYVVGVSSSDLHGDLQFVDIFTVRCRVLPAPRPDPELRFADDTPMPDQTTFDLGDVASGSYVGAGYRVANVGGAYLYVMPGYAGFILDNGNYAVSSQSLSIAPGESKGGGGFSCGGINNYGTAREISYVVGVSSSDLHGDLQFVDIFTVRCRVLPAVDTTPPTITATATPGMNGNGWNNTNVTVSYTCADTGSGVNQVASSLGNDVLTASGTATGTCVDNSGNSANATYTAQIDKVAPTVGWAGNANTYGLLATVAISCNALDSGSGIASNNCPSASGPAWSFGAGSHTLSATATDRAGNTSSASATFTVNVSPSALSALTKQFVQSSAKYLALRLPQRAAVDALVTAACNFLLNIGPTTAPALKTQFINAYKQAVQALVAPGWLTASRAATLKTLANSI